MCSTSKVNDVLSSLGTATAAVTTVVNVVSAVKLKHSRDDFFLVDIREADEIAASPLNPDTAITADAAIPMGKLFAASTEFDEWKNNGKTIVLLCNSGYRSSLTARHLTDCGFHAASLQRGILGLANPAATVPNFLVVLGTSSDAEKLTLALNAAAVAAANNETVVFAMMGDGVCTFLRKGNNKAGHSYCVEETFVGEPFQPCNALLNKMIGTGNAVVLACTSCCKKRGIEFGSDLLDCVQPMQMPDLLRMLGEAKKNLQFM